MSHRLILGDCIEKMDKLISSNVKVACEMEKRNSIQIEINREYLDIAKNRLQQIIRKE